MYRYDVFWLSQPLTVKEGCGSGWTRRGTKCAVVPCGARFCFSICNTTFIRFPQRTVYAVRYHCRILGERYKQQAAAHRGSVFFLPQGSGPDGQENVSQAFRETPRGR